MTVQEAKIKLKEARMRQRELRKEIDFYREIIFDAGDDPDILTEGLIERNKMLYRLYMKCQNYAEVSRQTGVHPAVVRNACSRITATLYRKGWRYELYKDLARIKPKKT